jgi:hypothetical protein
LYLDIIDLSMYIYSIIVIGNKQHFRLELKSGHCLDDSIGMEILGYLIVALVFLIVVIGGLLLIVFLIGLLTSGGSFNNNYTIRGDHSGTASSGKGGTMNEGDFHSGPGGYSANTAYPDTHYGGGFDGHDEGDFNR